MENNASSSELELMDGETKFTINNKETKFIKTYEGKEIGEDHDRLRLEGTRNRSRAYSEL